MAMVPGTTRRWGAIALVTALLLASVPAFAVGLGSAGHLSSPASTAAVTSSARLSPLNPGPAAPSAARVVPGTPAAAALAATKAEGLKPNVVFVPRPSATPAEQAAAKQTGVVSPLYTGSPAPMGLAYYGLSAGPGGSVVGTILNTTSLEATVAMNATGVQAADLYQNAPDSYGIQLNAVLTNVTLFGTSGYSFWTQNVVEYYPQTNFLVLITNVWNFSSGGALVTGNSVYAHGPDGTNDAGGLGYYYAELAIPQPEVLPFDLAIFLNSTLSAGRDAVDFSVVLESPTDPAEDLVEPYDYLVFNSLRAGGSSLLSPSNYTANGFHYDAYGLTNDFELTFGGPGGGSQATLFDADATLGLACWNGAAYRSVPAAYSFGGETGETVTGADVAWSNAAGGPFATYGTMTTGPSILTGLWNTTAVEGSYPVTLDVSPANAFDVLAPIGWSANFTVNESSVAPDARTDTFYLAPGRYSLVTELSDFAPVTTSLVVTGPATLSIDLASDPGLGIYTPLWAFSNAEIPALSTGGNGTPGSPYVLENQQVRTIVAAFGLYNDFGFPAYPAVFLQGTNASVAIVDPPSFVTSTNVVAAYPGRSLPYENDLQYWFWNVSNLSLVNATNISGWFVGSTYYPASFNPFSVVFYEGNHDLVAGDTFDSEGEGLLDFAGGTFFGPATVGGGNLTVWGNRFLEVPAPSSYLSLLPESLGLALELAAPNDLVYDNDLGTATTAWVVPMNLYTEAVASYPVTFNISRQPAATVHYAAGFPLEPLSGSIVGTSYQGGNFWWDYGIASNPFNGADDPYGLLPYAERGSTPIGLYGPAFYAATYIYPGGDHVPLVPVTLYPVTLRATGLPSGLDWVGGVSLRNGTPLDLAVANATSQIVEVPNGTYLLRGEPPVGWAGGSPHGERFVVAGAPTSASVAFHIAAGFRTLTFTEKGLEKRTAWSVSVNWSGGSAGLPPPGLNATETSTGTSLVFAVVPGLTYSYSVAPVAGYSLSSPATGSVAITRAHTSVGLAFSPVPFAVAFVESGLPAGALWKVTVDHRTYASRGASIVVDLPNGSYAFTVHAPRGYVVTPEAGTVTVDNGAGPTPVEFAER